MPIFDPEIEDDDRNDQEETRARSRVTVEVLIDGAAVEWPVSSFKLDQEAFEHHALSLNLTYDLVSPDTREILQESAKYYGKIGSSINIRVKPGDEYVAADQILEFFGTITNIVIRSSAKQTMTVEVEAQSPTFKMDQAKIFKPFLQSGRREMAESILGSYAIEQGSMEFAGDYMSRFEYFVQWQQTDWDLLRQLCSLTTSWLYYDGKKLCIENAKSKNNHNLTWLKNVGSCDIEMNVRQINFAAQSWDQAAKQPLEHYQAGSSTSYTGLASQAYKASKDLNPKKSVAIVTGKATEKSETKVHGLAEANSSLSQLVEVNIQSNVPSIKVGDTVKIADMGPAFAGTYFVKQVTHNVESGGTYFNTLIALPLEAANPRMLDTERFRRRYPVTAIVTNNQDPEKMGRIKVKFPYLPESGDALESQWIRTTSGSAGNGRGIYFIPEVDDEVLVVFEGGDANHPIAIGSLWNGKDKPDPSVYDDKNNYRVIYSRSGHQLIFDDTDGQESIKIIDKTSKNTITIDSKENTITILADKDIVLKAKENITMEAGKDFSVKATGKVDIEATQDLSAKGMNATIKAQTAMSLEGTANFEAKGGMMTLDSKGPSTVKGNPIMLN